MLREILRRPALVARGVYGFFPANAVGDDVELYTDDSRTEVLATFHFLRQQMDKPASQFNHCLADYIAPRPPERGEPLPDYLGAFAVSAGFGTEALCQEFERAQDDYNSIMTKALAPLAEAFAEFSTSGPAGMGLRRDENLSYAD